MTKRLILIFIIISGLVLGTEIFLPKILSSAVAQAMTNLTGSKKVSANLEKTPAILMLAGKFDRITLDAADAKIDKIIVGSMQVVMDNIELDEKTLLNGQKAVIKSAGDIKLSATITQEELANYLNTSVKGVKAATVNIEPEKVIIGSQLTLGGLVKLNLKVQGKITEDNHKVKFIPEHFFINNSPVANNSLLDGTFLAEIQLVDSDKLPFGVVIQEAVVQNGQITLKADNISR